MNNNLQKSSITDKVVDKIRSGQIKMRSKTYFILKTIFIVLSIIIVALFALYLVSFINFVLRSSGVWYLPVFGFRGIGILLRSLPWILILMAIVLIIVLETLVKRFSFSYRRPILYSIVAIIILVLLGGFIIGKTQLHPAFFHRAQERQLPVIGKPYREFGMPKFHNVHRGVVSELIDNGFRIETPREETLTVIISSETRFPIGTGIEENDIVIILGERDNSTIQAFGIRKIDDDINISPRRRMPMPNRMPMNWNR